MPDVKINSIKFTEDAYFFVLEDGEKLSKKEYYFDEEAGYLLRKERRETMRIQHFSSHRVAVL